MAEISLRRCKMKHLRIATLTIFLYLHSQLAALHKTEAQGMVPVIAQNVVRIAEADAVTLAQKK